MRYRAIFSDIDGTLLNSEHIVTEKTAEAIRENIGRGVLFALTSARSPAAIRPIMQKNDFKCCMIACNGALILDEEGRLCYERGLSVRETGDIVAFVEAFWPGVTWNLYTAEEWIVKSRTAPAIVREEGIVGVRAREGSVRTLDETAKIAKVLCMCSPAIIEAVERTMRQRFPKYTVARSSDRLLEITQAGVNKAQAIKLLCGARNIPMEQTLAFGDGYNDLGMLKAAGQGIAMGNAPAAVRAEADAVTLDNDRDGIAVFLNRNFTVGKDGGVLYND